MGVAPPLQREPDKRGGGTSQDTTIRESLAWVNQAADEVGLR
jgi:hypothetical protein